MDASDLLRNSLLQLSKQEKIRDVIEKAPVSRSVVRRFVPGAERADVVGAASEISASGRARVRVARKSTAAGPVPGRARAADSTARRRTG